MKTRFLILASILVSAATAFAADTAPTPTQTPAPVATPYSALAAPGPAVSSTEDWKGNPEAAHYNLGALTGLGIINATPGIALMGTASMKILDQGFIPGITNSVWIETELGPIFAKGSAGFQFSAHIRWDFVKDEDWTFYALGGFGGAHTPDALGDKFEFYPRVAVGALWNVFAAFTVRAEVSHELVVVGPQFDF